MSQLHDLTALEQAAAIRAGETSAVELTEHYLARSEELSEVVGAFVRTTPELAIVMAKSADDRVAATKDKSELPPLLGVVCPVKDLDFVAGIPTQFGSNVFEITPVADDNIVVKLREGGLVFTGKTNTPEFGTPCYTEPDNAPPARTPWDLSRSAGGSSGGAAAAVAAGLAPFAHGSDGGGSIRIPSSVTGLVGIKPTRGRISNGPLKDAIGDLATHGPIARTVADAAALLDVMSGNFPGDPITAAPPVHGTFLDAAYREPGTLRIGVFVDPPLVGSVPHPDVHAAIDATVAQLESLGHSIEPVNAPFNDSVLPLFMTLWSTLAGLTPVAPEAEPQLRPLTRYLREQGAAVTGGQLAATLSMIRMSARAAVESHSELDAVLCPTLADIPALVGQLRNDDDPAADFTAQATYSPYCACFNVTGQPAINVPLNWNEDGLPIGVQLVGRMNDEETIISLAAQLESVSDWHSRKPSIW